MARVRKAVDQWMMDAFAEPWQAFLDDKKERGDLVKIDNVWVDVPNVIQRVYTCDSTTCSPGIRRRGVESCCAELSVQITRAEEKMLQKNLDEVSAFMREHDPTWGAGDKDLDDIVEVDPDNPWAKQLKKRRKRCTFAFKGDEGQLWCGIHGWALREGKNVFEVKPKVCFLFPLLLQDLPDDDDGWLLSAIDEENAPLIGYAAFDELPCLHGDKTFGVTAAPAPPFYENERATITHLLGAGFMKKLDKLAAQVGRPALSDAPVQLQKRKRH